MISLLIIATTLLTRGVNNMQEAAFLFAAPPVALANYTYYFLESTGFNYTELVEKMPSMRENVFTTDFWTDEWVTQETIASVQNSTRYWLQEIPAAATQLPKQFLERVLPEKPKVQTIDMGMVYVSIYITSLMTVAMMVWLMSPGSSRSYHEIDEDHILVRKRKRVPEKFYDEGRMQLRSMTSSEDVFYELE
jgi:hypothetical protein